MTKADATANHPIAPAATNRSEQAAAILVVRSIVLGFLLLNVARTWADPDLWGHVKFGGDTLRHGFTASDPYSFASDVPWINHEWLAESLMYLAWASGANPGLIALKLLGIVLTLLTIGDGLRRDRVSSPAWDLLVFAAIVGMWARVFVLRPQVFSILIFAIVLWIVRSAERGRTTYLRVVPLLFAVWVNLHGAWIVGLGVLAIWVAAALAGIEPRAVSKRLLVTCLILGVVATLVNPYGWRMWTFLGSTVRFNRPNINDWRPLLETEGSVIVAWAVTAAVVVVACWRRLRHIPVSHLIIVVGLGLAAIRVNRLDVFFTLSAVMLLAPVFGGADHETLETGRPQFTRRLKAIAAAIVVAGVIAIWTMRANLTCVRLDGPWMPERESGAFIAANRLNGRLLSWFDWGQYAIWHFAPDLLVSLDGRRETVYSDEYLAEHLRLYFDPAASMELLRRLSPDYAWLPSGLPLVGALEAQGWTRLYSGPVSVVLSARKTGVEPVGTVTKPPCFPGP